MTVGARVIPRGTDRRGRDAYLAATRKASARLLARVATIEKQGPTEALLLAAEKPRPIVLYPDKKREAGAAHAV